MGILACAVFADTDTVNITEMRVYPLDRENTLMISPSGLTDTVRELLTHILGTPYRSPLEGIQEDSFVVEVKYWDKTMCINLGESGGRFMTVYCVLRCGCTRLSGGENCSMLLADSYYNKGEG